MLAAAAALVAAALCRGPAERAAAAPAPSPAPPPHDFLFVGVGSCASTACHNGNGPRGTKGSEYTTWIVNDPHSRAYTVLLNARSRTIQNNLNRYLPPDRQTTAEHNALCLRCHSVNPGQVPEGQDFQLADGVGCESCHGPAQEWKNKHYLPGWKQLSVAQKKAVGFHDTKDLTERATMCVQCHVGSPEKEVNHDLIAAGHPRLRFEFGAYLANYPKHWNAADDLARYPDLQARAWTVGQVVSAGAAMKLLHSRAADVAKPWPEFAEYDCFACHHQIETKSWRQRPTGRRVPGTPLFSTWYTAMLPTLSEAGPRPAPEDLGPLEDLKKLMFVPLPDRRQVARQADQADVMLTRWLRELERTPVDERTSAALLRRLADENRLAVANWDSAVQLYLALAADYAGLADRDPRYKQNAQLNSAIKALGVALEKTFPSPPGEHYDSPTDYRPESLGGALQNLQQQLGSR
jgi:hypothetical protein